MKRVVPHLTGVILVTVGFVIGSVLTGDNVIAQKIAALTGSGSPGKIVKWTSENALGNSSISEDKNRNLTIGGSIRFPDGSIQTSASTDSHFQQIRFTLAPGEISPVINLPKKDSPVRLELTTTGEILETFNGQIFVNSPLGAAIVVSQDSATGYIGVIALGNTGEGDIFIRVGFKFDVIMPHVNDPKIVAIHAQSTNVSAVTSPTISYCLNMWF